MEEVSSLLYIPHSKFVLQLTLLARHLSPTTPPASVKLMLLERLLSILEQSRCQCSKWSGGLSECAPTVALEQDVSSKVSSTLQRSPCQRQPALTWPVATPTTGNSSRPRLKIVPQFLNGSLISSEYPEECLWTGLVLTP